MKWKKYPRTTGMSRILGKSERTVNPYCARHSGGSIPSMPKLNERRGV